MGTVHSPPSEGWQAKPDGVVVSYLHDLYIRSSNLWKPKLNGASGWVCTISTLFQQPHDTPTHGKAF